MAPKIVGRETFFIIGKGNISSTKNGNMHLTRGAWGLHKQVEEIILFPN